MAPGITAAVCASRARAYSHGLVKLWGLHDINERLMREIGQTVISGPFAGLELTAMARQEHFGPYLLGTYELELHPWWHEVFKESFTQIVDVGASFGYYAVGMAQKFPRAAIYAFDTDRWARAAILEMAAANRVSNVSVNTACSPAWLRQHLREGALVISDCEGYEGELLCRSRVSALETATIIVELHETLSPGVSAAVVDTFSRTHVIREVASRTDTPLPVWPASSLMPDEIARASREVRGDQTWLFLRPGSR
jgi:precorrin-6B methylase 2